jgi:DNA-binding PadR family transcriptional regulator
VVNELGGEQRVGPVRSAVNAGVLSLVIEKPSYGGEIGRRFEARYEGLLGSRPQHVYKALEDLEKQALIEQMEPDEELEWAAQPMRVYRATAKGARAYRRWLRAPIAASGRTRNDVMVRLASTRADDVETTERLLDAYERAVLTMLRQPPVEGGESIVDRLVDEERRTLGDAQLRWVSRARDALREQACRHER